MSNRLLSCNLCDITKDSFNPRDAVTVPAGSVSSGLSVCGYSGDFSRLPNVHIEPEKYVEGFCPDTAFAVGTLFPELVHVYK